MLLNTFFKWMKVMLKEVPYFGSGLMVDWLIRSPCITTIIVWSLHKVNADRGCQICVCLTACFMFILLNKFRSNLVLGIQIKVIEQILFWFVLVKQVRCVKLQFCETFPHQNSANVSRLPCSSYILVLYA